MQPPNSIYFSLQAILRTSGFFESPSPAATCPVTALGSPRASRSAPRGPGSTRALRPSTCGRGQRTREMVFHVETNSLTSWYFFIHWTLRVRETKSRTREMVFRVRVPAPSGCQFLRRVRWSAKGTPHLPGYACCSHVSTFRQGWYADAAVIQATQPGKPAGC